MLQQNTVGKGVKTKRMNERKEKRLKRWIESLGLQAIQPVKTKSCLVWEYSCTNQSHGNTSTAHRKGLWSQPQLPLGQAGVQSRGAFPPLPRGRLLFAYLDKSCAHEWSFLQVTVVLTITYCFIYKPWSPVPKEVTKIPEAFAVGKNKSPIASWCTWCSKLKGTGQLLVSVVWAGKL